MGPDRGANTTDSKGGFGGHAMEEWPLVTMVISNLNGREVLRDCLNSIKRLDYPSYEVVVVDAGSTDGSTEMMKREFGWVNLVDAPGKGLPECNNIGVSRGTGTLVVVDLNNDDVVDPLWLKYQVRAFLFRRNLGAVCGKRLQYHNQQAVDSIGGRINLLRGEAPPIGNGLRDSYPLPELFRVDYIPVILTSRRIYNLVGGCDADYFIYFEDTDLSYQIGRLGLDIVVVSRAIFKHRGSTTTSKSARRQFYMMRRNELRFILKNFPLRYLPFAVCYQVVLNSLTEMSVSVPLVNKLLQWSSPSHRNFLATRRDQGLGLVVSGAILWNLRNLRATFAARAAAQARASAGTTILAGRGTDVDARL